MFEKSRGDFFLSLVDVSDIFYFFLLGEGESEALGGGGGHRFFIENPRTGGAEGPGGCLRRVGILGGGVNIIFLLFRGRNVHQAGLREFWMGG